MMKRLGRWYKTLFKRLSWPWRIALIAATILVGYLAMGLFLGILLLLLPFLLVIGLAKGNKGNRDWHISGQSDKDWYEENDRRALGEDY